MRKTQQHLILYDLHQGSGTDLNTNNITGFESGWSHVHLDMTADDSYLVVGTNGLKVYVLSYDGSAFTLTQTITITDDVNTTGNGNLYASITDDHQYLIIPVERSTADYRIDFYSFNAGSGQFESLNFTNQFISVDPILSNQMSESKEFFAVTTTSSTSLYRNPLTDGDNNLIATLPGGDSNKFSKNSEFLYINSGSTMMVYQQVCDEGFALMGGTCESLNITV